VRIVAAALGLAALAAVTLGWLQNPDHITASEAVGAARSAYIAAGLHGAVVNPHPAAGVYVAHDGGTRVPVWKTKTALRGGKVELWLSRVDGESVFLDDRAPDGASQLLTDTQFRRLADHYENPAATRQIHRNLVLTAAAALIALLAVRLTVVAQGPGALSLRPSRAEGRTTPAGGEDVAMATAGGSSPAGAPARRTGLRRLSPFGRRHPAPVAPPVPRLPPHPGRPLRAVQLRATEETS
jgi:hypothetical protein